MDISFLVFGFLQLLSFILVFELNDFFLSSSGLVFAIWKIDEFGHSFPRKDLLPKIVVFHGFKELNFLFF